METLITVNRPTLQAEITIRRDHYYPMTLLHYHIYDLIGGRRQSLNKGARVSIPYIRKALRDFYPYLSTADKRKLTNMAKGEGI